MRKALFAIALLGGLWVSARGGKYGFVYTNRHKAYRALRAKGFTKESAARIANAGHTHAGRSRMARKGARHRAG